ncbi:sodium:solute symporter family protein [Brevibacterium album]|uniref:sodium:solute symporter family protein n=1 Tax=Brevibacterium album TaxID=417948 RepID=UPI000402CA9C|nr:sodium:solute symporter family protein [Brevibacterium album]
MLHVWLIGGLAVYFLALLALSFVRQRTKSGEDFFLAGRRTPAWMLGFAFIATWYGGNSALISVDEAYADGMSSWWILGGPTVIAVLALIAFAPLIRRTGAMSQNGILASRYNAATGNLLSVVLTLYLVMWGASQMVAIGHFFESFFDISYFTAILIAVAVCVVYALVGGFRAVVYTEVFQFLLLLAGLIVTMCVALTLSGGWDNVSAIAAETREPGYFNLFHGIQLNLSFIISFGLAFMIDGAAWQRIQAAPTPKAARWTAVTALVGFVPLYFFVVITGIAALGVFGEVPAGGIVSTLAADHMPPWLTTLVFVGIAAAIMSTICTTFNVASLYITELTVKYALKDATQKQTVRTGRVATVAAAVLGMVVAVQLPSALEVLGLASELITAGLFWPMVFGFFWKRGNTPGAIASILAGGTFILYGFAIEFGAPLPHFWTDGPARILTGLALSLVAYLVVSLATKPETEKAGAFIAAARGKGGTAAAER